MPAPSYKPRPTDPYTIEEAAEVIETAKAQFETAIQERADKEAARAAEVRRLAEEELDGFYDQRTDEVRVARVSRRSIISVCSGTVPCFLVILLGVEYSDRWVG